ncbi:MAG: peptidoglycan DD-metalloendopeptidase family protein, partial [Gammaproteobacteria bacterium]|nr:peptidoglycan DD-metalloendopeptidase family protein [Gammaproteobacteria bacterium]
MSHVVIFIAAVFFAATTSLAQTQLTPRHSPVPGGIAVVAIDTPATVRPVVHFQSKRVMVLGSAGHWQAIVGIPLDTAPGEQTLEITALGNPPQQVAFAVQAKEYETQHLTITNKRMVDPTAKDLVRIEKESKVIQAAFRRFSETDAVPLDFVPPAQGPFSSPFGLRRFFNNEARKPHSGLDIAAAKGTPILAPAAGTVIAVGNFFFNGNTVMLDHGQGLISMYSHMDRIRIKEGQNVALGTPLGVVGMTGRVTGPHLHWTISLNDTRVDPMLLFSEQTLAQTQLTPR